MEIKAVDNKKVGYQGRKPQLGEENAHSVKNEEMAVKLPEISANMKQRNQLPKSTSDSVVDGERTSEQSLQIKKAVNEINKSRIGQQTEAVFGIHDDTNRVTIKIVDKKSKEVIKEFPPEKTLDMIAKVWEMAGIMVDEKG